MLDYVQLLRVRGLGLLLGGGSLLGGLLGGTLARGLLLGGLLSGLRILGLTLGGGSLLGSLLGGALARGLLLGGLLGRLLLGLSGLLGLVGDGHDGGVQQPVDGLVATDGDADGRQAAVGLELSLGSLPVGHAGLLELFLDVGVGGLEALLTHEGVEGEGLAGDVGSLVLQVSHELILGDTVGSKPVVQVGALIAELHQEVLAELLEDGLHVGRRGVALKALSELAGEQGAAVLPVAAKFEEDIAEMDPDEAKMFMEDLGLTETGLNRLIKTSYDLLGYISFLTAGEDDVHAWTIVRGTKAPKAAGKIHTDIERGFIRAEIVAFEDLKACGSMAAAKEKGLFRLEGKDYVMQDGDVTNFRFNV